MSELMHANRQWISRPADERFTDLVSMRDHFRRIRDTSRRAVVSTKKLECVPGSDNRSLSIVGPSGVGYEPTHWSFGQLATLAEANAEYLRKLGSHGLAPLAADCINAGLKVIRSAEDVSLLLRRPEPETRTIDAANGPRYGTVWNYDLCHNLVERFGNGIDGQWKAPGEFGKRVEITKDNTTFYASDRDMFVFLADEENRIEIPNRRNGSAGSLARGFFMWNSEVGSRTLGFCTFLFDFVCCNRIVWGAEQVFEVKVRHTASAPDRWLDEVTPVIEAYSRASDGPVIRAIEAARAHKLDKADEFLAKRFGPRMVDALQTIHANEELRPIETVWDAVTAVTAYARSIGNQDRRVDIERSAGELLKLAA